MYYVILHVPYGNHRKMLGLTCLNKFLCIYVCMFVSKADIHAMDKWMTLCGISNSDNC